MHDLFSKIGVSNPRLDDSSGDRAVEAGLPSLASKGDFLSERDDDGGGDVNDGWVWQSRGKKRLKREEAQASCSRCGLTVNVSPGSRGFRHGDGYTTSEREIVSTRFRCTIDRVPSSTPARCVDSLSGIGLTSLKTRSSGKDSDDSAGKYWRDAEIVQNNRCENKGGMSSMRMNSLRKRGGMSCIMMDTSARARRQQEGELGRPLAGPTSTVHPDLDNDATEQELLEKIMRDTLRVPQRYIEIPRA